MRKLKKAILSLSLVAAMVMGEAGVALAAEPQQAADDTEISADAVYGESELAQEEDATSGEAEKVVMEDVTLDKASNTDVTNLEVTYNSYSAEDYYDISFGGYGCKFVINVNGKYFTEIDNSDYVNDDNPAPMKYYTSVKFRDILYGGTYKIDVIPYMYTWEGPVAGTAVSKTVSVPTLSISNVEKSSYATYNRGYPNGGFVHISWNCDAKIAGTEYEIQRKEGNGPWVTLGKITNKAYDDYNNSISKKYQYRVRAAAGKNQYGQGTAGKWCSLKNGALTVSDVSLSAIYEGVGDGVSLGMYYNGICSGYEIYRSTNKTKGYKKIVKTAYNSYVDKKVKSGTYYYKARAYYYDEKTGKTYYGDFSEPKGVKLILSGVYVSAKQTGTSQVTLEWDKVNGVSGYEIWYKEAIQGDAYRLYKTTTGTKLKVSGLTNNTQYYFKIRAKKSGSTYYTSNECSCHIGFQSPSPSVTKRKVTSNKAKTAVTIKSTIKWDRIYGAKKIRVVGVTSGYYDKDGNYIPSTEKVLKTLKGTATSYTLTTKLTANNKGYDEIKVVAVKGKDEAGSQVYNYKALNDTAKLTVKRTNNAGSVISWKAVPGATKYHVYRVAPYGNRTYLGETDKCAFKDLNLTPGIEYTYRIVAENDKVNVASDLYTEIRKAYTHKLGTPKVKSATNSAAKQATINWNSVNYAGNYVVYRATSKNGKYKKIATVKNGKTTYTDTKLKKGTTYYYKVKATVKNAAGFSVSSKLSAIKFVKIKK